jgi:N6-adenosine-specific RNA methylase IME4
MKYHTILADPPWNESGGGRIKRGADRHYKLMTTKKIIKTMKYVLVGKVKKDAHMWLWVTNNYLKDGLEVMEELGFRYVTNVVWVKDRIGLGQYLRGKHELCLFGVKGRGIDLRQSRSEPSVINAKKTKHSAKPVEIYEKIEAVSTGPFLELFARDKREGWDVWGLEAPENE